MKKFYSLLTLGILCSGTMQAQVIPMMDLVKTPQTNFETPLMQLIMKSGQGLSEEKTASGWRNKSRFTGIQDAKGNQTLFSSEEWDTVGNKWVVDTRMSQVITYDGSNRPATNLFEMSQNGSIAIKKSQTFSYDGSGKYLPIRSIDSIWSPTPMAVGSVDSMVYNGSGKIEQRVFAMTFMGMYNVSSRYKFTYDGSGNLIEKLEQDYTSSDTWEDGTRYTYSYYPSGKIRSILEENHDGTSWSNQDLDSFFYDGSNRMIASVNYSPNGTAWIGDDREEYTYTGDNITEVININWIGSAWVNEKKITLNYNGGTLLSGIERPWNGTAWSTDTTARVNWTTPSTGLSSLSKASIGLYPNPATEVITVSGLEGVYTATITNLQGKTCMQQMISNEQSELMVSSLEPGVYVVSVDNGSQHMVTRFVKQ